MRRRDSRNLPFRKDRFEAAASRRLHRCPTRRVKSAPYANHSLIHQIQTEEPSDQGGIGSETENQGGRISLERQAGTSAEASC